MFWSSRRQAPETNVRETLSATALRRVEATLPRLPMEQAQNQAVQVAATLARTLPPDWERDLVQRLDQRPRLGEFPPELPADGDEIVDRSGFSLSVDRPGLVLRGCSNFRLEGTGPASDRARTQLHFVTLIDCHDFEIQDLTLQAGRNGLTLYRCRDFRIEGLHAEDFHGYALTLFACTEFDVADVSGFRNLAATVLCLGATSSGRFRRVLASGGRGFFNCDAGLHLNHCTPDVGMAQLPGDIHEARSIIEKTEKPKMLVFEDVVTHDNRAQGVYVEGAIACVFRRLRAYSNNKEGVCLDWGSALCTLEGGWISENGARRGMTPAEIEADFIQQFGILEDGSSAMKLPGFSLDNGAFNIVSDTTITHNYGGGVKLVRASPGCALWDNRIKRNDLGENPGYKFLELHSADLPDVNKEFVGTESLLDFGPSPELDLQRNLVG